MHPTNFVTLDLRFQRRPGGTPAATGGTHRKNVLYGLSALAVLCCTLTGCVLGPAALQASRTRYNEVIRRTTDEQLLLNLVRLQYGEAPGFLEIGSVAAQFVFQESVGITGTLNENVGTNPINPDVLQLRGEVGYEEQPTITFTPLQGEDFVKRLLAPLRFETITMLSRSGWSIDRVLRLTVRSINGLDNAGSASGPTPTVPPRYEAFAEVSRAFRILQTRGLFEAGYEERSKDLSAPISGETIDAEDLILAAREGYVFQPVADGDERYVLQGSSKVLVWRIPAVAAETEEVRRIVELLGLAPGRSSYEIRETAGSVSPTEPAGRRTHIDITTRSLMGTLFYLSQAVGVPERHRSQGVVTTTLDDSGQPFDWTEVIGDLLRIQSRATPPSNSAVAVRHRGHWFYIDDTDLRSKATFGLLAQLFALQAGGEPSAGPVLTLPLGG